MKIKVLIIEDEVLVADDIAGDLQKFGFEVVGTAISASEALEIVEQTEPNLILMDIQIKGDLDGIDLAAKIHEKRNIPVIFLTSNTGKQFVNRALETNPYAFITKPYTPADLVIAIELAVKRHNEHALQGAGEFDVTDSIFVKKGEFYRKILMNEVLYIEANGSYCSVYALSGIYTLSFNLNHFQNEIRHPSFKRIHRSYVVNLSRVDGFDKSTVVIGDKLIPVSNTHKEDLFRFFKKL